VGSDVRDFQVGHRVLSPFTTSCGHCFFCHSGLSARCDSWQFFGYQPPDDVDDDGRGIQGAQCEQIRVPLADSTLIQLPENVSIEEGMLLGDNFTTGFFCADQAAIQPDGVTVVLGCGAVGLSAVVAAKYLGAGTLVAVDAVPSRRQRAASLGAVVADPADAAEVVRQLGDKTGHRAADSVLEAVGSPAAQQLAFALVRPGGVISAVGMHTARHFAFSPEDAYNRNLTYRAGRCPVRSYLDRLLPEIASGQLKVPASEIITHPRYPLQKGPEAYRMFSQREEDCVKILLDPE
jgi:threonine dehydrogenase-like Zn-dependent dehydrogenase